jgi:predicted acylesterase/phospholipase RssA
LNGWLIASGVPAREIEDRWMNLEDAAEHRFQWPRRLSDGILNGHKVETWIRDIFGSVQPACEYGLVATEMKTLKPRLFRWPDLEWTHLAASCAVPLFLKQHRINGALYADGGLVDPLPVWAAIAMGANRIVTVNVLVHRPAVVKAAAWVAGRVGSYSQPPLEGIEVVNIVPSESIGELRDSMYWTHANAERLLRMGRRDAEQRKHLVVECLNRN